MHAVYVFAYSCYSAFCQLHALLHRPVLRLISTTTARCVALKATLIDRPTRYDALERNAQRSAAVVQMLHIE